MTGWIIAIVAVVVLFGVGAIFCAPWSPVHKRIEQANDRPASAVEIVKHSDGIN